MRNKILPAAMLGAASAPGPDLWRAALASLPMGILFGYGAELVDQMIDAEANVPKGLRNMGAWCWKNKVPLHWPLLGILTTVIFSHSLLIRFEVLSLPTYAAIIAVFPIPLTIPAMERGSTKAIMSALALVFLYGLALVVLQGIYRGG